MKKSLALVAALMVSAAVVAQKDEMKVLKKIYDKETVSAKDVTEYKAAVATLDANPSLTEGDRIYTNFYKGMLPLLEMDAEVNAPDVKANPQKMGQIMQKYMSIKNIEAISSAMHPVLEYEKKTGKQIYTADIKETTQFYGPLVLQYAIALGNQNKYAESAKVLYALYQMDKTNMDNLYYAANYAISGKDYDNALKYYYELRDAKYTGEGTAYMATSLASDKEETFGSKADRDRAISMKTHAKPREEKVPSKRGEIYKNIALILIEQGKDNEAKSALADAKRENPDDTGIILAEADMYYRLKDMESYKRSISEVLAKNPNDADMLYNLGVVTMQAGDNAAAESYFTKAIAVKPDYVNAYINLSSIKLAGEKDLVDQMNKLGTSAADNKKYDVLKKKRDDLLREALAPLEKAHQIDPKNDDVITNLISIYGYFEMTDKVKALKALRGQ